MWPLQTKSVFPRKTFIRSVTRTPETLPSKNHHHTNVYKPLTHIILLTHSVLSCIWTHKNSYKPAASHLSWISLPLFTVLSQRFLHTGLSDSSCHSQEWRGIRLAVKSSPKHCSFTLKQVFLARQVWICIWTHTYTVCIYLCLCTYIYRYTMPYKRV